MHVRVCRECGEEFRPEAVVCSDCGGALEDRDDAAVGTGPDAGAEPASAGLPPVAELVSVADAVTAAEIEPAAKRLSEAGIAFAVSGAVHQFRLLVAPADVAAARAALALGAPAVEEAALSACPACGAALPALAAECPECGLGLAVPPETAE